MPRCSARDPYDGADVVVSGARAKRCEPRGDTRALEEAAAVAAVLSHHIDKRMRELFPDGDARLGLHPKAPELADDDGVFVEVQ